MNNKYMEFAMKEALKAYKKGEVPVGAVIVKNNKIIARAHNTIEKTNNATKHAEINVIEKASKKIKNWRLIDCDLYVTLEPCEMCESAIELSRIRNVYYATSKNVKKNSKKTQKIKLINYETTCTHYIKSFFENRR